MILNSIRPDWLYQVPPALRFEQQQIVADTPTWVIITLTVVFILSVRTCWDEIARRREDRAWRESFASNSEEWGCPVMGEVATDSGKRSE